MQLGKVVIKVILNGIVLWVIFRVVNFKDTQNYDRNQVLSHKTAKSIQDAIPLIYVVTATHQRLVQRAELTRLSNVFQLVKRLHWIVVEPNGQISLKIQKLLNSSGINFTYFAQETNPSDQKNAGIGWITTNHNPAVQAVVYFADDDNSYDIQIFQEMRYTKKLSAWPVAFSGKRKYETPEVENGKVVRFSAWNTNTKFPIDMSGFAINVEVLWKYHPRFTDFGMAYKNNETSDRQNRPQCFKVRSLKIRNRFPINKKKYATLPKKSVFSTTYWNLWVSNVLHLCT